MSVQKYKGSLTCLWKTHLKDKWPLVQEAFRAGILVPGARAGRANPVPQPMCLGFRWHRWVGGAEGRLVCCGVLASTLVYASVVC